MSPAIGTQNAAKEARKLEQTASTNIQTVEEAKGNEIHCLDQQVAALQLIIDQDKSCAVRERVLQAALFGVVLINMISLRLAPALHIGPLALAGWLVVAAYVYKPRLMRLARTKLLSRTHKLHTS